MLASIQQVQSGQDLSQSEMVEIMRQIMAGDLPAAHVKAFLIALHEKGETADELIGAARVLRECMTPIPCHRHPLTDTCGTGGTGAGIFNVSTAAAIVAAGAGVAIAKHGNRKVTSRSGSADVLAQLGVNIEASAESVAHCIDEIGLGFCFAPVFHSAMKHVAPIRREIGTPTLFNWLGPLCNPAQADYQVLGVGQAALQSKMTDVLIGLGTKRAIVLHSRDGLCELSPVAPSDAILFENHQSQSLELSPADFGLETGAIEEIQVDSPEDSATLIRHVLDNQPGTARTIVIMNAAAAIRLNRPELDWQAAGELAAESIASGAARQKLAELARFSHQ